MKNLLLFLLLAFHCKAASFSWNQNPESYVTGYKVWREDSGQYFLLGSTTNTTFDLGILTDTICVCVSATAFGNIDGAKSEIMVINPSELPPYVYVSLHGPKTWTFALSRSNTEFGGKRFFRFDIVEDYAQLQDSFTLNFAETKVSNRILVGSGYDNPKVTIDLR